MKFDSFHEKCAISVCQLFYVRMIGLVGKTSSEMDTLKKDLGSEQYPLMINDG